MSSKILSYAELEVLVAAQADQIKELNKKASELEQLIAELPEHFYWIDKEGVLLNCNQQQAKSLGFGDRNEVIGKNIYALLEQKSKQHAASLRKINDNVIRSQAAKIIEETVQLSDQKKIYLSYKKSFINKHNQEAGILGISFDISERIILEEELRSDRDKRIVNEEMLKNFLKDLRYQITGQSFCAFSAQEIVSEIHDYLANIIALMPGNIYWMDSNGRLLGCNNNQLKTLGLKSYDKFVGKMYYEVLEEKSAKKVWEINSKVINSNQALCLEEQGLDSSGKLAYYLTNKIPLHNKEGDVVGLLGISIDITERKKDEKLLKEAKDKIEKSNQGITLLAASIAHELRTPLLAISSGMRGINKYFPELLKGYSMARDSLEGVPYIQNTQFEILKNISASLQQEVKYANLVIDMLLVKLSNSDDSAHYKTMPISDGVKQALVICTDFSRHNPFHL